MSGAASYYRPYETDVDSEEDEDDSDEDHDEDDVENIRAEKDPRYAILRAAGPAMDTVAKQEKYNSKAPGAPYDITTDVKSFANHTYLDPPKATKTSLVSIKSINRDSRIFPTPFRFQLKLPRVYKDVTKFQLVQMSFPNNASNVQASTLFTSSFLDKIINEGVPPECSSICISLVNCTPASNAVAMVEQGRVNAQGEPLLVTLTVPSGNDTGSALTQQLNLQANSTPPLNLISYSDFKDAFMATGDLTILFNEPGDNYISRTTNQQFGTHTKEQIMSSYYTSAYVEALPQITEDIAFVAYYFPILKEVCATGRAKPFLQLGIAESYDAAAEWVMGPFQGFADPLYLSLCQVNQDALDAYRPHLTFELRNINRYTWSYKDRRYTTLHDSLHTSLQRDLQKQYQSVLNQELTLANLNGNSFSALKTTLKVNQSVYAHLTRHMSTTLGQYSFATGYTYAGGAAHKTDQETYQASTLCEDSDFNDLFCFRSTMGRIFGNDRGTVFSFSTFADYHSTLSSYYQIVQSTTIAVSSIHGAVHQDYHAYVSTKYGSVLPSSMIQNRSYLSNQGLPVSFITNQNVYVPGMPMMGLTPRTAATAIVPDAVNPDAYYTFPPSTNCSSICCTVIQQMINSWYSGVPVNTVINSLSYRLGILNMTPGTFNIFSTVSQITSTANTNLLFSINREQGFNTLDVSMNEAYHINNETTGQVKMFSGKILMEALGNSGVSQTVIQNPVTFEPPLGKLDRLQFEIFYDDEAITPAWLYLPYFLSIEEWDATFQIDESVAFSNPNTGWGLRPTVPIADDPDKMGGFIWLTHGDNPNNA